MFLILVFFIPETPRFLALKGREEKAMGGLRRINGEDKANEILSDIRESLNKVNQSGKLFSYGVLVIMVGLAIAIFQQMIGINVIMYYAPVIFKDMGAETNASLLSTIYVGVVNLVFTILAIMMVDKLGRKPLLKGGAIIMAVAMLTVGFIFYFGLSQANIDGEQVNQFANQGSAIAAFVFILIFIAGFAISWGPVAWVLLSELFPNKIRGQAMALATATLWGSNWIISWTFPIMNNSSYLIDKFNHGFAYWIYGVIGVLAAIFVSKFVPETKGKTLEQLESLWRK